MQMRAEYVVDLVVSDAERKQLVAPALLAGKIERRRMALVLAGARVHQDGMARRPHHERLVGDDHHAQRRIEDLRRHRGQVMPEDGLVVGRKEVLRPPPRSVAFDHRVDGDVADPQLLHSLSPWLVGGKRNGRLAAVQAEANACGSSDSARQVAGLPNGWRPPCCRTFNWPMAARALGRAVSASDRVR